MHSSSKAINIRSDKSICPPAAENRNVEEQMPNNLKQALPCAPQLQAGTPLSGCDTAFRLYSETCISFNVLPRILNLGDVTIIKAFKD